MRDGPTTSVDDDEIALLLMERDKEGVRLLVQAHGRRVLGFLRKYFRAIADDAFQEALRKVLTSIDTFDDTKGKLGAWFLTVARNAALDVIRGEKKHQHAGYDDAGDVSAPAWGLGGSSVEEEAYDPQALDKDRALLTEILDGLAPLQREILKLDPK